MDSETHSPAKDIAAFTVGSLLAIWAFWLWGMAGATGSKLSQSYGEEALMVTLLSLSVFSLAPLLHSSRFPLVRLLAALPMGALIFVAAWLVLQASRNIIYGGWGDDIPGAHEPFWEYGMIVLPAIASLLMMERAVKKGAREQLSDKAVSLASKQDQ